MIPARTRVSSFGVDAGAAERMDGPGVVDDGDAGGASGFSSPAHAASPR